MTRLCVNAKLCRRSLQGKTTDGNRYLHTTNRSLQAKRKVYGFCIVIIQILHISIARGNAGKHVIEFVNLLYRIAFSLSIGYMYAQ